MKSTATPAAALRQNFRHAKVLVIDDNPDHLALIERAMAKCLPEVEPVLTNSEETAFAYLNNCMLREARLPKLILLDLYVPTRDAAWRILRRIKSLPEPLSTIPVVLLSSSESKEDILEAYKNGASSYLIKPLDAHEWQSRFQMLRTYWWETVLLPTPLTPLAKRPW